MDEHSKHSGTPQPFATVSEAVLSLFLDDLAKIEGLEEVAANMRAAVINDGIFAEPAIRGAIFPDAT